MQQPTKEFAMKLISYLPSRPDYETWINVISAIGNTFSENESLDILLSHFRDEKPGEHAYKLRNQLKRVSFATLVYLAKAGGYVPSANDYKDYATQNTYKPKTSHHKPETVQIKTVTKINADEKVYKWTDEYEDEVVNCAIEFMDVQNYSIDKAVFLAHKKFSEDTAIPKSNIRMYDFQVNETFHNKPSDEVIKQNLCNFTMCRGDVEDIILEITRGFGIMPGIMQSDGKFKSKSENWIYSDLLFIDVDGSLSIDEALRIPETQSALFIYTTPSHSDEKHRFRIVFAFPGRVRDSTEYYRVFDYYTKLYRADKKCRNLNRFFYGNDNAIIFNIQNGEISQYQNGKQL